MFPMEQNKTVTVLSDTGLKLVLNVKSPLTSRPKCVVVDPDHLFLLRGLRVSHPVAL